MASMLVAISLRSMTGELSASISTDHVGGGVWVSQVSSRAVQHWLDSF